MRPPTRPIQRAIEAAGAACYRSNSSAHGLLCCLSLWQDTAFLDQATGENRAVAIPPCPSNLGVRRLTPYVVLVECRSDKSAQPEGFEAS